MANKSFRTDFSKPHQNAVVGPRMFGDIGHAYREGFMQATLALLAAAAGERYFDPETEENVVVFVDVLVYPICFNARHFVELFLKDSIRGVSALGPNSPPIGVIATHDITHLWATFVDAIKRDSRLVELGMPLEEVVKDIAEVDNTSMAFRYSHDLNDNVHLPDLEHINLGVLGGRLREMFILAEEFSLCLSILQQEYEQGTFTGKLHRGKLKAIAKRLPPHSNWKAELGPVKKEICEQFALTSNDFHRAVELIKCHREFSDLIGVEIPLTGLPADVFKRLALVYAGEAGHDVITRDEWLRLDAVMEISRNYQYSEFYDRYLKDISDPDYAPPLDPAHIVRNAYAQNQRLRRGLLKLGQRTLLAALAKAIPLLAEPMKSPPQRSPEETTAFVNEILRRLRPPHSSSGSTEGNPSSC